MNTLCRFLGQFIEIVLGLLGMRRRFEIRVAFSATRLSAEHLRAAYEVVTPIVRRAIATKQSEEITDSVAHVVARNRSRGRGTR